MLKSHVKTTPDNNVKKRRDIHAKWRVLELIEQLGEAQIERALGVSRVTIHRWKKQEVIPSQAMMVALESLAGQTYHMIECGMWRDWKVGETGRLHGPGYKYGLNGGDLLGFWYLRQMIPNYQRQIKLLKAQLAAAYEELAAGGAAANERAYALGEEPPRATPAPAHTKPLWAFRRRLASRFGR